MNKINFFDLTREELSNLLISIDAKPFHAKQIMRWVYESGYHDFFLMSDIGKLLQQKLNELICFTLPEVQVCQQATDNTAKYLFRLADNHTVETVVMPYSFGDSICISTQVGCNAGCRFCASGQLKMQRNLTVGEMIGQIMAVNKILNPQNRRVSNVVMMGTGEPLHNFDNVIKFINLVNDPFALNIGIRHISLSTSGVTPKIKELADIGLDVSLAISLHATTDEARNKIMPVNKIYPLNTLLESIKYYQSKSGRKLTIEYLLIDGINDQDEDALRLVKMFQHAPKPILINLLNLNEVSGSEFKKSPRLNSFFNLLKKHKMNVTVRKSFGGEIDAACGQLRAKFVE